MNGIDVQIPAWHHPHYISHERTSYSIHWQFKPFTGDEPEPELPDNASRAFHDACAAHEYGTAERRAASEAWSAAEHEARAANTLWQVARHNRRVAGLLQQVAPLVAAFQQAKAQAVDAYESLHATPDGFWQAKLLTIVQLREKALEAAGELDGASRELTTAADGLPERALKELPSHTELEKAAGVDLGDWYARESYSYGDGPDTRDLNELFAEQDQRITAVTGLFAGAERS